jgi:hypothetical protein
MVSLKDQYLVHCFFLLYINDLPKITNGNSNIVLFADDSSIIVNSPNPTNFKININTIFQNVNRWFSTNWWSTNTAKTRYMQFVTKNSSLIDLNIIHGNKKLANICKTKCLGITSDNTLSWKTHTDIIIPKLSSACFVIVPRITEDGMFFLFSFYNDLSINNLEKFLL